MSKIISFTNGERIWETSNFGYLVRVNAYYTLYPYIFSFHSPEALEQAKAYSAYQAFAFLQSDVPKSVVEDAEAFELLKQLMSEKKQVVELWRKELQAADSPTAFNKLKNQSATPEAPGFFRRHKKDEIQYLKKKNKVASEADGVDLFSRSLECSQEEAIEQREIVNLFCEFTTKLYEAKKKPELQQLIEKLPADITKEFICHCVSKAKSGAPTSQGAVADIVNWHAPIIAIIYAMDRLVPFERNMRHHFVASLELFAARHHAFYNVIVDNFYNYSNERHLKGEKVYKLDIPKSSLAPPLSSTKLQEDLLKRVIAWHDRINKVK